MNPIDQILDHVAQLEHGDSFEKPAETEKRTEKFASSYKGSYIDLYVLANALETIGKTIKGEARDFAYSEAELLGHTEKFDHKGIGVTPFEGYQKYDFESDKVRDKYLKQLEVIQEKIEPFKQQQKAVKESLKSREEKLVKEGKAELTSITRGLRISKK